MICSNCQAEYRDGFTVCADCDVPLIAQFADPLRSRQNDSSGAQFRETPSSEHQAPELEEDPFCEFWQGDDSRIHAELCAVLAEAGIPCKTVRREDYLFRLTAKSALKIGVPFSLYQRAEAAVQEAFGSDDHDNSAIPLLAAPEPEPASEESRNPETAADFDPSSFFPEDATVEAWIGTDAYTAEFLVAALRTNEIHCRWNGTAVREQLFVLPGDEARAREIIREVIEASPPPD
jgi:hypothetical protein